jgi:hypothetical protein
MNFTECLRRVGIILGVFGGALGALVGYVIGSKGGSPNRFIGLVSGVPIGFLMPWGAVKVIAWIGEVFCKRA